MHSSCGHGPVRPDLSDFERFWSDFERNFDDFEQSFTIFRQISRDPLGVRWDAACWCWQAGERLASLSIDNILLSERPSKYWKNIWPLHLHAVCVVRDRN